MNYGYYETENDCGRQCQQTVQTRPCGGIPADLTFLLLFWSSKKVEENFNQPTQIAEGDYQLTLAYGANQQRNKTVLKRNNDTVSTHYYINKYYEKEVDTAGIIKHYHYIYGDNGIVALHISTAEPDTTSGSVVIKTLLTDSMYYIHTDHVGSYCAITNARYRVVQRNCFDPWGNYAFDYYKATIVIIKSAGDTIPGLTFPITARGFTGHEHYPYFQIINMNGRLYDPVIARFFSPDKYVANSSFTQDFNRYSYARNNPLMYTDPSGEIAWLIPIAYCVIVGAYEGNRMAKSQGLKGADAAAYTFMGGFIGGFSAAFGTVVGIGIGAAFVSTSFISGAIIGGASGLASGAINGMGMAVLSGGDIWRATWQGGVIGMGMGALIGGFTGGMQAKANGGSFWTEKGATYDMLAPPIDGNTVEVGAEMEYSNSYAQEVSDKSYGKNVPGVRKLYANGTHPPEYTTDGDIVFNKDKKPVSGTTRSYGMGKGCDVYLYKQAFVSKEQLLIVMGHEYSHAFFCQYPAFQYEKSQEAACILGDYRQACALRYNVDYYYYRYLSIKNDLDAYQYFLPSRPKSVIF